MPRTFYSDYVNHCLRFYARYPKPIFYNEVDKNNWQACDKALTEFTEDDRKMLLGIYADGDTIADNVYKIATERNIKQDSIWKLLNNLEHKVAESRKLI